jgi:hypothetical protein
MDHSLRAQYFPTIFGSPRFDLQIKLQTGFLTRILPDDRLIPTDKILCVGVLNVGAERSYVSAIKLSVLEMSSEAKWRETMVSGCKGPSVYGRNLGTCTRCSNVLPRREDPHGRARC